MMLAIERAGRSQSQAAGSPMTLAALDSIARPISDDAATRASPGRPLTFRSPVETVDALRHQAPSALDTRDPPAAAGIRSGSCRARSTASSELCPSLSFEPAPIQREDFIDFFGNSATSSPFGRTPHT